MNIDYRKRIKNLELCPNAYLNGKESDSLEICQWSEDGTFKWTIASFRYNKKEDCFYIEECCERLDDININWADFGYLVALGRRYLKLMKEAERN